LDNTLLHGSSLYFLGRGMHARGVISTRDVARGAWQQLLFRLVGERRSDMETVRDRSLALGAGVEVAPLVELGGDIYDQFLAPRILAEAVALAEDHLERGDDVYLVTTAPIELAWLVAARLGLTGALGTVSEIADGRWTGRLVGELLHGVAKADAVRTLADSVGYELARCAAYSDSANDLPLLCAVGDPHAVNPDRRLRAIAQDQGWQIHEFRLRHRHRTLAAAAAPPVRRCRRSRRLRAAEAARQREPCRPAEPTRHRRSRGPYRLPTRAQRRRRQRSASTPRRHPTTRPGGPQDPARHPPHKRLTPARQAAVADILNETQLPAPWQCH